MKNFLPLLALIAIGCAPPPGTANNAGPNTSPGPVNNPSGNLTLTSSTFQNGGVIPAGGQIPDLEWSGVPKGTENIVLEVTDSDTGNPPFVHWVVCNMDPGAGRVTGGVSGKNGSGANGYYPPEPPTGETHHYHFKLIAVDQQLQVGDGFEIQDIDKYMQGHILGTAEIVGTFRGQ